MGKDGRGGSMDPSAFLQVATAPHSASALPRGSRRELRLAARAGIAARAALDTRSRLVPLVGNNE
jgi:hypothetical protein